MCKLAVTKKCYVQISQRGDAYRFQSRLEGLGFLTTKYAKMIERELYRNETSSTCLIISHLIVKFTPSTIETVKT